MLWNVVTKWRVKTEKHKPPQAGWGADRTPSRVNENRVEWHAVGEAYDQLWTAIDKEALASNFEELFLL